MPNKRPLTGFLVFLAMAVDLSAVLFLPGSQHFLVAQTESDRSSPADGIELLKRLQSDRFSERQQATRQVLKQLPSMLPLLEKSIENGDADFQLRALKILETIAMGDDPQSEPALNALKNISLSTDIPLSRKAQSSSYQVLLYRQYVAARKLQRLNARVVFSPILNDQKYPLADSVEVNEHWRGDREDLQQIAELFGLSSLELSHHQVDDKLFLAMDSIFALNRLKIKRCSITDQSIAYLSRLNSLSELEILYCPIGRGCFDSLQEFQRLSSVRLVGTDIDPACAALLEQQLNAVVDIRRGAFLGIRYSPSESTCRLTSIVPGSGADRAGFQVGDEIVQFNEHPIREHRELTRYLREQNARDKVAFKVKRGQAVIELDVVMGEWE